MEDKSLTLVGTVRFADGENAETTLQLTPKRIRLSVAAGGVTNRESWDRAHVVRLRVISPRPDTWMPSLLLRDGKSVTLAFVLDEVDAERLVAAF